MVNQPSGESWAEWSKYILMTLQQVVTEASDARRDLDRYKEETSDRIAKLNSEMSVLTTKVAFICAIISSVTALVVKVFVV